MSFARRIVIDTGVLVSAAIRPSPFPRWPSKKPGCSLTCVRAMATWAELQDVLMRPKFDCYVTPELRRTFLQGFRQRTVNIAVTEAVADCADPKDNKFLALAAVAEAELILASDILTNKTF